jgi:excisionase family DNA binding protein
MEQDTKNRETGLTEELFTIEEVADRLKLSRQTIWRFTKDKKIDTVKIGKSVRYTAAHIAQLIGEQRKAS